MTRFAISPMFEVVTSFRLLTAGSRHPVHGGWLDQVRPRVTAAGLHAGLLAELIPPDGYLPDFLTPPPSELRPSLASELAAVRATPAAQIEADLDLLGNTSRRCLALQADPDAKLDGLVE